MVIADSVEYRGMQYNLKEVTGSGVIVLRDGEISGATYPGIDPRTCLGYSDDGHVYFMVADGRVEFYSYGLTYPEMGSIIESIRMLMGCEPGWWRFYPNAYTTSDSGYIPNTEPAF